MDQRDRLIEAAIRCLQRRGYAHTTTREIVAEAGAHLPAVNYYFGSKDELLRLAVTRALRDWTKAVLAALEGTPAEDPREELRRAMSAFLESLPKSRDSVVAAAEVFAQAPRSTELAALLDQEYQAARELIVQHITATVSERPPAPDVQALAMVLQALFDGLAMQWLVEPQRLPDAEQLVRALDLMCSVRDD
ncbi:TetR/AcrR family transcriptional regulator [Lipingzhangella sp. LS1_29]|uniref:TetR/AcrR family transcriptional regulator n=2 Tax=Lipingzhangella rawalii TaxID=2055835 RepID=A0ABU2HBK3_9ACTN|nr:TetR/AcrR family transcriptional regulator [Lipingzhangella rawalii]